MAFQNKSLDGIAAEIRERKGEVGRLSLVEITVEESLVIRSLVTSAILAKASNENIGLVILVFTFDLLRKPQNHYLEESSFWRLFESELGIPAGRERSYLYRQFSATFRRHEIELKWSQGNTKREFVQTIRDELVQAKRFRSLKRQQAITFFCWFFNLKPLAEINRSLLERYTKETNNEFYVTDQALPSLRHECKIVSEVLQWGERENLLFAHTTWDELCSRVINELEGLYDLRNIRLITGQAELRHLLCLVQNHRTPSQFRAEVEQLPNQTIVFSDGRQLSGRQFLANFKLEEVHFGSCRLGSTLYQIVPQTWLRLEEIAIWPWAEIVQLRSGWLGYRKKIPFVTTLNGQNISSRRCCVNGDWFFVWVGMVTRGIPLQIDANYVTQSEGITWDTALGVIEDKAGGAKLGIILKKLQIHFHQKPNARFKIATSQNTEKWENLDTDGNRQLFRDVTLPLAHFELPVEVSVGIDAHCKSQKFVPATSYLFSTQTLESIPPKGVRHSDGRFFWLFCRNDDIPVFDNSSLDLEETNNFSPFRVFRVAWKDATHPFELRIGELEWKIQQQRFFHLWLTPRSFTLPNSGEVTYALAPHQYCDFGEIAWGIATNLPLHSKDVDQAIRCQWLRRDEVLLDESIENILQLDSNVFKFSKDFLSRLGETVPSEYHDCIPYTLRLYALSPANHSQATLAESDITLLPTFTVALPPMVASSEQLTLTFRSPHLNLWNANRHLWDREIEKKVSVSTRHQLKEHQVRGVVGVISDILKTSIQLKGKGENETVTVLSCPFVWSVLLFERPLDENDHAYGNFYRSQNLNFYGLPSSLIAFSTTPNASVCIDMDGNTLWEGQAGHDGVLLLENLSFLRNQCFKPSNFFEASSNGKTTQIQILWSPRVFSVDSINEGKSIKLVFSGPSEAKIITSFTKGNNIVLNHSFSCHSCTECIEFNVPKAIHDSAWEVEFALELPDSSIIPSTVLRHNRPNTISSDNCISNGLGVSSPELLPLVLPKLI